MIGSLVGASTPPSASIVTATSEPGDRARELQDIPSVVRLERAGRAGRLALEDPRLVRSGSSGACSRPETTSAASPERSRRPVRRRPPAAPIGRWDPRGSRGPTARSRSFETEAHRARSQHRRWQLQPPRRRARTSAVGGDEREPCCRAPTSLRDDALAELCGRVGDSTAYASAAAVSCIVASSSRHCAQVARWRS